MNPRLIKFAVELQVGDKTENEKNYVQFKKNKRFFFSQYKTVPIEIHSEYSE